MIFFDSSIQINQRTKCNSFTSLLLDVYVWLNMFGRLSAHHQERTTALGASGFTVGAWRLVWQTTTYKASNATLQR
jgi:hypothetical protein